MFKWVKGFNKGDINKVLIVKAEQMLSAGTIYTFKKKVGYING